MDHPSTLRDLASPLDLAVVGAAVVVGVVVGAPGVGVALGLVLWAALVVLRLLRRTATSTGARAGGVRGIDPFALGEPWRFFVRDALQARSRFADVLGRAPAGPIRDRLADIGRRLDEGVEQVWATAQRGHGLRQARRRIDDASVARRLAEARAAAAADDRDPLRQDDVAARTAASLQSQLDTARRLDEVTTRAEGRLRLLQAQLDESVTRAAELAAASGDVVELAGVGTDIERLVEEMEALRLALDETGGLAAGSG